MQAVNALRWRYDQTDPAMMLWTAAVERFDLSLPTGARVLELGCAETDWLERMQVQHPDFEMIGVDVFPQPRPLTIAGNAMDADLFAANTFDAVVLLGALEHFGLGFYGDPIDDDGDTRTMENVARWLKPGGWVYFDVPCQPTYGVRPNRHFRDYSPDAVTSRLLVPRLTETARAYSWPEPTLGKWLDAAPTEPLVPYWFVAVVAVKEAA